MPLIAHIRRKLITACIVAVPTLSGCVSPNSGTMPTDVASLQTLANRGNPIAANDLGVLYSNGIKVPQDFAEAKKWYEFANAHGNPAGAFNLGIAYEKGQGTAKDVPEAVKWFHTAADQNFAPAKFLLGVLYRTGNGVPKDDVESNRLMQSAALQGWPLAQGFVAALYLDGTPELPADDSLAYQWSSLAAAKLTGLPGALAKNVRDSATKGLSPEELAAAQTATAAWKPGTPVISLFPANSGPRPTRLRGSGSGFVIGKDGEIATDFHVVPNCREIKLIDPNGKFNVITHIVADDRKDDLALLAGGGFGTRLKIRSSPAELGEGISSYGFPLGPILSSTGNLTTGSVSGATGMAGNVKAFQITAPVQPGSSGGPIVDDSGAVVGIVAAKLNALAIAAATGDVSQNVNFAWRIGLLKSLMDDKGIAYEQSGKTGTRPEKDLASLLQKAAVKIECWR